MHRSAHPSLLVAVVTVFLAVVLLHPAAELAAAEPAVRTATVKKAARVTVKPSAKTVSSKISFTFA